MGPLDAFWHVTNLFAIAAMTAAVSAAGAKLLWRRELAAVRWIRMAAYAAAGASAAMLGGLVLSGRDGRIASYAAMVCATALMLWWRGFGPGRSEPRSR